MPDNVHVDEIARARLGPRPRQGSLAHRSDWHWSQPADRRRRRICPRCRVIRDSHPDRAPGMVTDSVGKLQPGDSHQIERAWPEATWPNRIAYSGSSTIPRAESRSATRRPTGFALRPPLDREQAANGVRIAGIGGDAIHGVGRDSDDRTRRARNAFRLMSSTAGVFMGLVVTAPG